LALGCFAAIPTAYLPKGWDKPIIIKQHAQLLS